jgi:hypothetical protein
MLNKEKIISEFNLVTFGSKGWMHSSKSTCPKCNKWDKFGILFTPKGGIINCFYCKEPKSLYKYLKEIGRDDLINNEKVFKTIDETLSSLKESNNINHNNDLLQEVKLPNGLKKVYFDKYLNNRGFTPEQYSLFGVSKTDKDIFLRNYIVFVIKQNNVNVGWLARSKYSKEWHKQNLKEYKEKGVLLKLRYRNSEGTDFAKILLGIDEITVNTHTVYLVEGLFDKSNVDNELGLYNNEDIKCLCTFGDKISSYQINLLRFKKSVKNIIILYDYGTSKQSKIYGSELMKYFNVKVGYFPDEDIDAGEAKKSYLENILNNSKSFLDFYLSRI